MKIISEVFLFNDVLSVMFEDGTCLKFEDVNGYCCERRYMSNDGDYLSEFVGARYVGYEVKDAPDIHDGDGVHEVQFLEIKTSKGSITLSMHNEHNGCYGGFCLVVTEIIPQ